MMEVQSAKAAGVATVDAPTASRRNEVGLALQSTLLQRSVRLGVAPPSSFFDKLRADWLAGRRL